MWPALLPRLDDPAHPVALKAWEVLMVMGDVCGDFLRRRVVAKVWPPLVRTLESLASQSILKDKFYRLVKCPGHQQPGMIFRLSQTIGVTYQLIPSPLTQPNS